MVRIFIGLAVLVTIAHADDYTVDGEHDFHAEIRFAKDTGQVHEATQIALRVGDAKLVRAQTETVQLPLIEKIIQLTPDRWLAIGWTSFGEGLERMVAWIVDRKGTSVRIADELAWQSDRSHAGLAIEDDAGTLRVGIPAVAKDGHALQDWQLRIGGNVVDLAKLHYVKLATTLFAPPVEDKRECDCSITWFAVGDSFRPVQ